MIAALLGAGPESSVDAPRDKATEAVAAQITRGLLRALYHQGFACLTEVTLANGRRADVVALGDDGEVRIVEVKSSVADFQCDRKWTDYIEFCDRFAFAVTADFPTELLPPEFGYWVADAYGAEELRPSPLAPIHASRRKALTLRLARLAASRLQTLLDSTP